MSMPSMTEIGRWTLSPGLRASVVTPDTAKAGRTHEIGSARRCIETRHLLQDEGGCRDRGTWVVVLGSQSGSMRSTRIVCRKKANHGQPWDAKPQVAVGAMAGLPSAMRKTFQSSTSAPPAANSDRKTQTDLGGNETPPSVAARECGRVSRRWRTGFGVF